MIPRAKEIREEKMNDLNEMMEYFTNDFEDYAIQRAIGYIQNIKISNFWIDNCDTEPYQLVRKIYSSGLKVCGMKGSDGTMVKVHRITGTINIYVPQN